MARRSPALVVIVSLSLLQLANCQSTTVDGESCGTTSDDLRPVKAQLASFQRDVSHKFRHLENVIQQRTGVTTEQSQVTALKGKYRLHRANL